MSNHMCVCLKHFIKEDFCAKGKAYHLYNCHNILN